MNSVSLSFNFDELFLLKGNLKKMMEKLVGLEFSINCKGNDDECEYISGYIKILSVDKNTLDVLHLKSDGRCGGFEFTPGTELEKYFITFETFEEKMRTGRYMPVIIGEFEEEFNECWKEYHIFMKEPK